MHELRKVGPFLFGGLKSKPVRFDDTSITLHWLTVLLVGVQFATVLLREQIPGEPAALLLILHRSAGLATWMVVVFRLIWRRWFAYLPPFPAHMPRLQQAAAKLNEYGLYALLLLQPVAGLGNTLLHGHAFVLFFWQVPAMMAPNKPLAYLFEQMHETGAWLLAAMVGLHAAAALFHALVLRDKVLQRMWPGGS